MKLKTDFVTNSSSTAFIITNTSDKKKTLVDFVKENPQLIEEYFQQYLSGDWVKEQEKAKYIKEYNQEKLIESARIEDITFKPHTQTECVFGDEQGTLVGRVFDYILRDGGSSKSFKWRFLEYLR